MAGDARWLLRPAGPVQSLLVRPGRLYVGTGDGRILMYALERPDAQPGAQPTAVLESKGAAICCLAMARIAPALARCGGGDAAMVVDTGVDEMPVVEEDIVAGDSAGGVTVFWRSRILLRRAISGLPVVALCCAGHLNDAREPAIVCADNGGTVSCFGLTGEHWRMRLADGGLARDWSVRDMLPVPVGPMAAVLALADGSHAVHVFSRSQRLYSVPVAAAESTRVTCLCVGRFGGDAADAVAAATSDGRIYLLRAIGLGAATVKDEHGDAGANAPTRRLYARLAYAVTHMRRVALPGDGGDVLVCAGHMSALHCLYGADGHVVVRTPDWTVALDAMAEPNAAAAGSDALSVLLVAGLMDGTVRGYRVQLAA